MRRHIVTTVLAALMLMSAQLSAQTQPGGIQPLCQIDCGGEGDPNIFIVYNGFEAGSRPPEGGPYTYTIRVQNAGTGSGFYEVGCSGDLSCSISPESGTLAPDEQDTLTVTYYTSGAGTFSHTITLWRYPLDAYVLEQAAIAVGPAMQVHLQPVAGQAIASGDSLIALFTHPSGITQASLKLFVDGTQRTTSTGVRGSGVAVWVAGLSLAGGEHHLTSYGCASTGRCDSMTTAFTVLGPPVNYAVDDSLPEAQGEGQFGLLPGALPLPPTNLRGCSVNPSDPEILLNSPFTYAYQYGTPEGYIFLPGLFYGGDIEISSVTVDRTANNTRTCATLQYLDMGDYDWNYWAHSDPNDPLLSTYPYADGPLSGGGGMFMAAADGSAVRRGVPVARPNGTHKPEWHYGPGYTPAPGGAVIFAENPGAINPNSYNVTLNGTAIVTNGNPGSGVTRVSLELIGSTYRINASHALVNTANPDFPFDPDSSPNGGWNELVASIADSSGNRTYVRARFAVLKPGAAKALGTTVLRDFRRSSEGDCAAFGPFQCGGVTLAQAVPGFVSRDRPRAVHLVYQSLAAGAPVIMPVEVRVNREDMAPDSVQVFTTRNGVHDTASWYAGSKGPAGHPLLWENANETRVAAAAVPQAAASEAVVQPLSVTVRGHFTTGSGQVTRDSTVSLEMVRPLWMDTVQTRFGAGWNLAELGRLAVVEPQAGQRRAVYQSGDGSYVVFRDSAGQWLAPAGITSRLADTTLTGGDTVIRQVLYLTNGASVGFDAFGRQRWTQDLVGNKTVYEYSGAGSRLSYIQDPTTSRFSFNYTSGRVASIDVRQAGTGAFRRMVDLAYTGARLTRVIQWIDSTRNDTTLYKYETGASYALLDTIVDPRGNYSTIGYDPVHGTPWWLTRPNPNGGATRGTAVFRDSWRRMLPRNGYGRRAYGASTGQPLERLLYPNQGRGTFYPFAGRPVDFLVDGRGAATLVRPVPTEPTLTPDFLLVMYPNLPTRTITRDSAGRVVRIVSRMDSLTGAAQVGEAVDSVMYDYNALGEIARIVRATQAYPVDPGRQLDTTTFSYDQVSSGRLSARCTRLLTAADPFGAVTTTVYGASGVSRCLPARIIGPNADTTRFSYGTLTAGAASTTRPTGVRGPLHDSVAVQYDATFWNANQAVRAYDQATTRMFFNVYGYTDSIATPVGGPTVMRHDKLGRVYLQRTGQGTTAPVTRTHYMRGGLVDSVLVYGTSGNVTATAQTTVQVTRYTYNALGWRDTVVTPGGQTSGGRRQVFRNFDAFGNPLWEYRGNGSYVVRLFDGDGRPAIEALSPVHPYFSVDGQPFASTAEDAAYRNLGMVQNRTLAGASGSSREYDVNGRLQLMVDSLLTHRYGYSPRGALIADTLDFANGLRAVRRYSYNRRGLRESVLDTIWKSGTRIGYGRANYGYDALGRLDTLVSYRDSGAASLVRLGMARWYYDRAGNDTLMTVTLGTSGVPLQVRAAFDSLGRAVRRSARTASRLWYDWTPSYDLGDRVTYSIGVEPTAWTLQVDTEVVSTNQTYDGAGVGRLAATGRSGPSSGASGETWTYDTFGNRLSAGIVGGGADAMDYGSDNQLQHRNRMDCPTCSVVGSWLLNDRTGNRLASLDTVQGGYFGPTSIMSYTAKGQLFFSVTSTASRQNFDYNWHWYDGNGLRIATHRASGGSWVPGTDYSDNGDRSYYLYDGADVAQMVWCSGATCTVRQRFMSGGLDEPLAGYFVPPYGAAQPLMFVPDAQGSTRAALRANGGRESNAMYWARNPFGVLLNAGDAGSFNTETGFTGASTPNSNTGFTYLRNRWYDASTGRFLTQDPIGLAGGINLYSYAGNNPVAFSDPFGLCKPFPSCLYEAVAVWGASRRDALGTAVQIGAVVTDALAEVTGVNRVGEQLGNGDINGAIKTVGEAAMMGRAAAVAGEGMQALRAYRRPSGATTAAQRASVQGQACVVCGATADRMVAGHRTALVREYYETGTVDMTRARSLEAVQPECPTCSAREGAAMSRFSQAMKKLLGLD